MNPSFCLEYEVSNEVTVTILKNILLDVRLSVRFSRSVVSDSLQPHGLQQARLPCPSPTPRACSNSCPSSRWCHPAISSSVVPFSSYLQYLSSAAAAAKALQSCPTLCDPRDGSPPSLGFSRQEHWNGLPFPSPICPLLQFNEVKQVFWSWRKCILQCILISFCSPCHVVPRINQSLYVRNRLLFHCTSVQSLSRVRLFATPWIAARQASLSITNCRSSLRLRSIKSVMPSSHLILCRPLLLLPPIPPSIRVFSNESTLRMRWPKY